MLSYDIVKKLKEAGFPLEVISRKRVDHSDGVEIREEYITPTLEELIEACGISFFDLRRYIDTSNNNLIWAASGVKNWGNYETGSTPSEAVANLWLALNKK